jgi:hypothetical protein
MVSTNQREEIISSWCCGPGCPRVAALATGISDSEITHHTVIRWLPLLEVSLEEEERPLDDGAGPRVVIQYVEAMVSARMRDDFKCRIPGDCLLYESIHRGV